MYKTDEILGKTTKTVSDKFTELTENISNKSVEALHNTENDLMNAMRNVSSQVQYHLIDMMQTLSIPRNVMQALQNSDEMDIDKKAEELKQVENENDIINQRLKKYDMPWENIKSPDKEMDIAFMPKALRKYM